MKLIRLLIKTIYHHIKYYLIALFVLIVLLLVYNKVISIYQHDSAQEILYNNTSETNKISVTVVGDYLDHTKNNKVIEITDEYEIYRILRIAKRTEESMWDRLIVCYCRKEENLRFQCHQNDGSIFEFSLVDYYSIASESFPSIKPHLTKSSAFELGVWLGEHGLIPKNN